MNVKQILHNKLLITMLAVIFSVMSVFANSNDILSKIENDIYGFDYINDSTQKRVTRLEKTIYGKSFAGDINKRITKLSGDVSADVIGLEISPSRDTFLEEENEIEDSSVNYPIVNEIEQQIFGKTYKQRDFHSRIVAIEKKLFGKIYDVDDYPTRMDRIKAEIMPETIAQNSLYNSGKYDNYDGSYYNDEMINSMEFAKNSKTGFNMPFGQKNYTRPYNNYGDLPQSNSFGENNELAYNLGEMEREIFGTEFPNDDIQTRIKRLNSVKNAKKSFPKYDSQKFSQHMSTAMQIGAMILMILAMVL